MVMALYQNDIGPSQTSGLNFRKLSAQDWRIGHFFWEDFVDGNQYFVQVGWG